MSRKKKISKKQIGELDKMQPQEQSQKVSFLSQVVDRAHLRESYTSLLLGIVVVVVVIVTGVSIVKGMNGFAKKPTTDISSQRTENTQKMETTYTVAEGDSLTSISEKFYGTADKWADIAQANNIQDETVTPGMKLMIPKATQSAEVVQSQEANGKITGDSYTVGEGESLWDIAVRAYGDGYQWPRIVEANNPENPDYVPPGTVLKIPR